MSSFYDVIVIGGGAAGLMCAIEAGKRGKRVLVLEHNQQLGRKILISGGGRCNFTNLYAAPENYLSQNPKFCLSALNRYTPQDFIALVKQYNIPFYEKKLGQLFCSDSSKRIVAMLQTECNQAHVDICLGKHVQTVEKHDTFRLHCGSECYRSRALVIATGGVSVPKVGATDFGYRIAQQFGLSITPIRPALVPLKFYPEDHHWTELRGISLDVVVRYQKAEFRENMLFSHRGLSGPAILQISSYWREGETITIDLLPERSLEVILLENKNRPCCLSSLLEPFWPKRFVRKWCDLYGCNRPIVQLSQKEIRQIVYTVHHWPMRLHSTEGFGKAEVTLGGVDTRELSSKTMESKKVPGLYFIGEVLDVTGHLGGYNFQWAWASGYCAGQGI